MGSGGSEKKHISPLPRRDARQIYNPPSGKYSASIGNFSNGEDYVVALYANIVVVLILFYNLAQNVSPHNAKASSVLLKSTPENVSVVCQAHTLCRFKGASVY